MKIQTVITLFLLVSATLSYPTKPLNERSTELTWQAWLLVDDQNQNKQNNDGGAMKKKVIAKSVFIVPTFNPEKMPPCAEGYASDSMGRCLEVFQVDTKNQLQFLLSKLQNHLENNHKTSTGPEKFTIEIPETNDDTSAALVLTQNPKSDEKYTNNMAASNAHSDLSKLNIEDKNSEEVMETIISTPTTSISMETETITDPIITEQVFSTVSNYGDEKIMDGATITTSAEDETTEAMPTTYVREENRPAIFFKLPITTQENEQSNGILVNSRIRFKDDTFSNDQPPTQDSTNLDYVNSSRVTFKHSTQMDADLLTSENVRHTTNMIGFQDEHQNVEHPHFNKQSQEYQNHRNRDKNFWRLKSNWKDSDDRNSFVVKLSNINFNDLVVQNRHSSPMYRQIPAEHLSYIFGRRISNR